MTLVRRISLIAAAAFSAVTTTVMAFNPQPDPPGFGIVSITPDQTIRINVVCFPHQVLDVPPGPCSGELIFHDMAGNVLGSARVRLAPGEATFLDFTAATRTEVGSRVGIDPCWIPGPDSGRALPTVEVFDTATGATTLFVNPVTPRMSLIRLESRERR